MATSVNLDIVFHRLDSKIYILKPLQHKDLGREL
jgi:hypothetical protein